MAYYNTNDETGAELQASRQQTSKQKTEVLAVFETYPTTPLTPDQIHDFISENSVVKGSGSWPITSIRRAITDLTKDHKLYKTSIKKMGSYGKRVHCWVVQCPHENTKAFAENVSKDNGEFLEEEICTDCDQIVRTMIGRG
tara:strand:- start:217 stop:639 length:423 start_codon:yes stop_codon:yes gene_type:complete